MQVNNHIPRGQAKLIFGREHPHFRVINYLKAAKSSSKAEVAPTEATQRTSQGVNREVNARDMGKNLTTVICESPRGRLCNMGVDMSSQRNADDNSFRRL